MSTMQTYQTLDENIKKVMDMRTMLKNLVIPSITEIELTNEWKTLLSIKTNYLKTSIYELLHNNDIICNKCHKIAIYTTNNTNLCWEHSI